MPDGDGTTEVEAGSNDHDMPDKDGKTEVGAIEDEVKGTVANLTHVVSGLVYMQKMQENRQVFEERFGQRFGQLDATIADAVDADAVDAAIAAAVERNLQQPQPAEPHRRTLFV
jgi:hypothetical protein